LRVPGHPDLGIMLPNRGDRLLPCRLGYRLGLVHPQKLDPRLGLDAVEIMPKTDKGVFNPPVLGPDVFLADLVMCIQPRLGPDRRLDLRKAGLVQRVHEFSPADDNPALAAHAPLIAPDRRHLGERRGLGRTTAPVGPAIPGPAREYRYQLRG